MVVSEGAANGSRDVEIPEDVIDAFGNYIRLVKIIIIFKMR